jgi:hydrogenase expression/formation protein HypE
MRDLTRGGLASALVEIAEASKTRMRVDEATLSVRDDVRGACEILGLDPLYVANEGRFVCFTPPEDAHRALEIMKKHPLGKSANIIGAVEDGDGSLVTLRSHIGTTRIVDMLSGEQLPRIC